MKTTFSAFLMKTCLLSFILFAAITCFSQKKQLSHFKASSDTIILTTEKVKGIGMFPGGGRELVFNDTTERYDFPVVFPKDITQPKLAWDFVDIKPYTYTRLKKERSAYLASFIQQNVPQKMDTSHIPSLADCVVAIMTGMKGSEPIFIVDQNNNKDFRDDTIRSIQVLDFKNPRQLIKCQCRIYNGKEMADDYGWVNIGTFPGRKSLYCFMTHRMVSSFSVGKEHYQLEAMSSAPATNFCFDTPDFALTIDKGIKKDSLSTGDLLKTGEYIRLNSQYYAIDHIIYNGQYITLVKVKDIGSKTGTQVGMLAPAFSCTATSGDRVSLNEYKGKYVLLANITDCWSAVSSYVSYREMAEQYKGKVEMLAIDNIPKAQPKLIEELKLPGKFILANDPANETIFPYRPQFSSRTCFLIDPQGRIADKFEIGEWKARMKKLAREFKIYN